MILNTVLMALAVLLAAKHGRRSRRRQAPLVPVKWQIQIALGTLADNTALLAAATAAFQQGFDIITTHVMWSIRDVSSGGEGPIEVGIAGNDYSVAEIVEALDASPLRNSGVEMERSRRKVRLAGAFPGGVGDDVLNDGKPIKSKMFIRAPVGQAPLNVWVVNRSGAPLTTGAVIEATGVCWGRWT